jgi:glycosyltransferase involved in cell wall biosynthesis
MRVLSIIASNIFSGPHNHDARLNEALAQAGVETVVALPEEPGDALKRLRAAGVKVITYASHRPLRPLPKSASHVRYLKNLIRNIQVVRKAIREYKIDLVQLSDPFHPHGGFAAKLEKRPVAVHVIGMGGSLAARTMASLITCRLADVILTNGIKTRDAYPGLKRLQARMVSYFSPIDLVRFRPDVVRRRAARTELELAPRDIAIGYIARLHPEKDHHTCLRAVALLHKRCPNVRFIMMGGVHPGYSEYLSSIWKTTEALGLRAGIDVIHKDAGARVADLAQGFDFGWSTGFQEGATSSVGEAMALGVPVVGTGNSAVREMIEESVSGFLVGIKQPEELARVSSALVEDQILRERMGRRARERAVKLFSTEICAAKHLEAYDMALCSIRDGTRLKKDAEPSVSQI